VEHEDLALAALALGLAVVVTQIHPALALPLFLGGIVIGVLGVRALLRRDELVERLSGDRDAYAISEVRARAAREATMGRRRVFAAAIRGRLSQPPESLYGERAQLVAEELEALASELADDRLELDPAAAVACARLVDDFISSPLLNLALPPDELRSRIRQIRSGFRHRRLVA